MLDTEFQEAFRDSAKDLIGRHDNMARCRQKAKNPAVDRKVWAEVAEAGWFSLLVPEEAGGLDRNLADLSVIAQQAGEQLFAEPYLVGSVQIIQALLGAPAGALRDELLDRAMAGDLVAGLAWQETLGQVEIKVPVVTATRQGEELALSGTKRLVGPVE